MHQAWCPPRITTPTLATSLGSGPYCPPWTYGVEIEAQKAPKVTQAVAKLEPGNLSTESVPFSTGYTPSQAGSHSLGTWDGTCWACWAQSRLHRLMSPHSHPLRQRLVVPIFQTRSHNKSVTESGSQSLSTGLLPH